MGKEEIKEYMEKKKEESKINGSNLSDLNMYLFQELDRLNDEFIINREEELIMNTKGYRFNNAELTNTGHILSQIESKIRKLKK